MEINKILSADLLDILFEGRNKSYGAYELRKSYSRRLLASLGVMLTVMLLLWGGYLLANKNKQMAANGFFIVDTVVLHTAPPPPQDLPATPPPPARKMPEMQKPRTIAFTTPQIVTQDVPEGEKPPTMDEVANAKIGTITNPEGGDEVGPTPPDGQGIANGVVDKPGKDPNYDDSTFIAVEIDASYPGGKPAWTRFLVKNLSNSYPQEAADQGIQGKVVIQFIVDREGNVSDIEAISGPKELYDAAIRVIKKSGKWVPAEQNGRKVKAWKRQPIVFQLDEGL